jgi:hypothetical protein
MIKKNEVNNINQKKEIKVVDNIPGGEYANAAQFQYNKEELHLMFLNMFGLNGRVVSKIITSPGHFKKIIKTMSQVMKKYEDQFGEVKEVESNNSEIGFKV